MPSPAVSDRGTFPVQQNVKNFANTLTPEPYLSLHSSNSSPNVKNEEQRYRSHSVIQIQVPLNAQNFFSSCPSSEHSLLICSTNTQTADEKSSQKSEQDSAELTDVII